VWQPSSQVLGSLGVDVGTVGPHKTLDRAEGRGGAPNGGDLLIRPSCKLQKVRCMGTGGERVMSGHELIELADNLERIRRALARHLDQSHDDKVRDDPGSGTMEPSS
jgi:hypothetical protein